MLTPSQLAIAMNLSPRARQVVDFMAKAGAVSARTATVDLGISDASLSRRITEIIQAGIPIKRNRKKHPTTGIQYTSYTFEGQ